MTLFNRLNWLAVLLAATIPSFAAEPTIDEITVTADFRGRATSEVPFSVSVLDADFLEQTAIQHFEELVNIVPNMNWSGDGHRARYFQIRGVGELEQYEGAPNPSIGFLIDDIDFSGIGTIATLFDMESVEVLRGPQGSRYGANALGGLIYMRSQAATAERDGRLQLMLGDDNTQSLALALGGALNDSQSISGRVSAQKYTSDGFRENAYLGRSDTNGRDELTLRARLRFETAGSLSVNLAMLYSNIDNGYDAFSLDNSYQMLSDKPGKDAQESLGASLRLNWALSETLSATAITAIADSDIDFSFDADWGNDDSWDPVTYDYVSANERTRRTLSQEFRIATDLWLVGLYAIRLEDDVVATNRGDYYDPFYDFADALDTSFGSNYQATNIAAFGQYERPLSTKMTLSAGLRIERRSTSYADTDGLRADPGENMWGGELSLSHALSDELRGYVSLSKGYKAGGFNLGFAPDDKRDFGTEDMLTLEAGIKAFLLESRLQINAAVFANRRDSQQVRSATQLNPNDPASFIFFTDNVGEGEALGFEADVRWLVTDTLDIYATVGLLDAKVKNGREVAHAPPYTLAAGVAYRNSNGLFARLDATAKDAFFFDAGHDQKSQAFELMNVRIGYESESWLASFWVRNVFDKNYAVRGFFFGNEPPDFPDTLYTRLGDPRQMGITIERRF